MNKKGEKREEAYPTVDPNILSGSPSSFNSLHRQPISLHQAIEPCEKKEQEAMYSNGKKRDEDEEIVEEEEEEKNGDIREKRPNSQLHPLYSP
jgi:hypothetical protein